MKKFDVLTPIGLIIGMVMVIFGIVSSGGLAGFMAFVSISSLLIVIGGVLGALFISFPMSDLKSVFKVGRQAFHTDEQDLKGLIETFVSLAEKARREGLLALEAEMEAIEDPFIKKGVLLAIDGVEPEVINDIMTAEIIAMEDRHAKGRNIFEKAAEFAPAWGMIGTLIGLVLMLKNLNDPSTLGPNMAIALLTTLYGSLMANLFFQPTAAKLAIKSEKEVFLKQIVIEGVIGVQGGQNPKILEEKLSAFLPINERIAEKVVEEEEEGVLNA
ncbi:flagellar motor protein MotP [Metabacillus iocasae]|uniref:Chemotaxis protein MotA n=1 Tax=Priestia iocasae TaxID=2291674 RepID=A0ABS2QNZ7_9BACI|nr:flagellar motor protein MotP [Metabacillus iocasae]MBM7701185.1 chemotaxis protein MotA [Metabacillus iocasae]